MTHLKLTKSCLSRPYDKLVKGIIEGMIFVIPSTPFTTDNNLITDTININGQKAIRINNNKSVWNDTLRIDIDICLENSVQNLDCKLNYYVYDISKSNIKLFGNDQSDILDYVSYIKLIIKINESSSISIECVDIIHNLSKDIIDRLLKQKIEDDTFNDYRSMTCQDYCIHSEYIKKKINKS